MRMSRPKGRLTEGEVVRVPMSLSASACRISFPTLPPSSIYFCPSPSPNERINEHTDLVGEPFAGVFEEEADCLEGDLEEGEDLGEEVLGDLAGEVVGDLLGEVIEDLVGEESDGDLLIDVLLGVEVSFPGLLEEGEEGRVCL